MKYVAALLVVLTALMGNYLYEDYKAEEKREALAYTARKEIDPYNVKMFLETKAKAEAGDAVAQYRLGHLYADGCGVTKDAARATEWFRTSAIQGNTDAQTSLAICYTQNDKGVRKDLVEAAKLFRMAARQSKPISVMILGEYYQNGSGVVKDDIEAYAYYTLGSIRTGRKDYYHEKLEKGMTKEEILAGLKRAKELQKEIPE